MNVFAASRHNVTLCVTLCLPQVRMDIKNVII